MPDILLVQPPIEEFYLTCKRTIPYGLASICASLEAKGYSTQILDALATNKSKPIDYPDGFSHLKPYYDRDDISMFSLFFQFKHFGYSYEHLGTTVRNKKPFLVGISSLFTAYCDQAFQTARVIKKFYPQAYIVMGGHHPTHFPKEVLDCRAVDFALRGEGETSLGLLCDALKNKTDLKNVPGLAFRDKDKIRINPPAWIKDLKCLPPPALDQINQSYYQRNKKAAITVVSSRGCPMPCSYCSVSSTASHGRFRQRDVMDVLKEIEEQANRLSIGFIDFEDENLSLDKNWIMTLLSGLNKIFKENPPELRAMNGLYPPSLDQEIMTAMKKAGFKTLNLSLGSFSKEQLVRFKRPDVRKAHDRSLEIAQKLRLNCVSYIIAGAPGQTAMTSLNDLVCLAQKRTLVGLSIFYPAPGSLDYGVCQKQKLLPQSFSLMRSTALPIDDTTTRLEAVTLLRLARILNFIKSHIDIHGSLPPARSFTDKTIMDDPIDRNNISLKLIQYFLDDGIIRGMDKEKNIYAHKTDLKLCRKFIRQIKNIPVMGVEKGPLIFS
ncbi:MAG: B12-binding domain-containing radical SAM protein [Desulfobacteraceae bacterium]|nr:B12-binding domain-containing radical SAM protein [Desulfobacteraceae bacterium]